MPRIVSVCLTHWPVTRLRRALAAPDDGTPLVVAAAGPGGLCLTAVDAKAQALGLRPGEPLGRVRARIGTPLQVHPADPEADAAALVRLCLWAQRYTPCVAPFGTAECSEGFFLDVAGASHLQGGEAGLMADLAGRLAAHAIPVRLALADSPGAAFALARHGRDRAIVPPGEAPKALRALPVEALRLEPALVTALKRLGLRRIGALAEAPRAPLARRFGEVLLTRLDQALGHRPEPLVPIGEAIAYGAGRGFLDPIGRQETIVATVHWLMRRIAPRLEADGLGACGVRLTLHRVDNRVRSLDLGFAEPTRCAEHVARLARLRLERLGSALDAGFGFETVRLDVTVTGAMPKQQTTLPAVSVPQALALGQLVDALRQRTGRRVIRLEPRASHVPERADVLAPWRSEAGSLQPIPSAPAGQRRRGRAQALQDEAVQDEAVDGRGGASPEPVTRVTLNWPAPDDGLRPRPIVLFERSEAAEVIALAPEGPPERFRWRRRLHRVAHAEGPERIAGEWWRETAAARDYYVVECEAGRRLWLYRDGAHAPGEPAAWFVHGLFA
ncbi:Y-family DNA polymerase [Methylobacterium soli]|uniref:DNA polymerase Y family protein n=1 Tax=Methylobacterium soli TaxID=553447 RepID=A0A6L3SZQ8_9HYPH|nr:DNA polymerase Y family protein [Methylobacterium soli]KAB1079588.1 DNA polymerase Y family protein [Methylobacterium soli]GJE44544.1 Protein ImuB [Methylobacterium soli]